jgi:hypothetical protein
VKHDCHVIDVPAPDGLQARLMRFNDCEHSDCVVCDREGTGWFIFLAPEGHDLWLCTGRRTRYAFAPLHGIMLEDPNMLESLPKVCALIGLAWDGLHGRPGLVMAQHAMYEQMPLKTALKLALKTFGEVLEWRAVIQQSSTGELLREAVTDVEAAAARN